jgi:signal transduction histidine kinase
MALETLRARLVVGSIFWAVGLMAAAMVMGTVVLWGFPQLTRRVHHVAMFTFATICIITGYVQIRGGLQPVRALRQRLADIRDGRATRLVGEYPSEVAPVINELNALLDDREKRVAEAIAKAGDLAHGLKTPLAVLAKEAARAEAAGQTELAATLAQQVERMRRQIDYHLTHARAAAGATTSASTPVAASVDGLIRTMRRVHADRRITIDSAIHPAHVVRATRHDLDEMLGNLLDNACKWCRSSVVVGSTRAGSAIAITVDDDGAGIAPGLRERVLARGVRADEAAPGSGLGLAIVRDLTGLYRGSLTLGDSPQGGLRATLRLPGVGD